MKKASGKVSTIFLTIMMILLISLVAMFFFQKEVERKRVKELALEWDKSRVAVAQLDTQVQTLEKRNFLLEEKNKEADERINSLMDELELEEALREELKGEIAGLKENVEVAVASKTAMEHELLDREAQLGLVQKKVEALSADLEKAERVRIKLEKEIEHFRIYQGVTALERPSVAAKGQPVIPAVDSDPLVDAMKTIGQHDNVELDKIVVAPSTVLQGRIVSIDTVTEFVILSLGEKHGLLSGKVLSVYRGNAYLGDVQVTRVQHEMSAADFLPPLTSGLVQKNDQVVAKE